MRVTPQRIRRTRARLAAEHGFTMLLALSVLTVTMLLSAAVFTVVRGDAQLSGVDLQGKQAYAAAQAGLQVYLNALNNNSSAGWWQTCANDTTTTATNPGGWVAMPGSTTGVSYKYQPWITASGGTCSSTNLVGTLIDPTTGALRMEFTGKAGNETRTIVAGLHTTSPLSYLWYTKYEKEDTAIVNDQCNTFYYSQTSSWWSNHSDCEIEFGAGDTVNGPMYTQDQFLIQSNATPKPRLGRLNSTDVVASMAPGTNSQLVCAFTNCQGATVSNPSPGASLVDLPADNSNIVNDATNHGVKLTGTTTLTINSTTETATGYNCKTNVSTDTCTAVSIDLTAKPLIYVANASGCTPPAYNPKTVTYQTNTTGHYYGCAGDLYVTGTYDRPLTLWAQDDVILTGSLTNATDTNPSGTTSPSGSATLGVVADQYVRVMHDGLTSSGACPTGVGNPNRTIDGAILTLAHSFFVDNYQCGGAPTSQVPTSGLLTIHGSLIQYFRGIVQLSGSGGYVKNYDYDDRLQVMLPPYLFDAVTTQWNVFRETLCSPTAASSNSNSCAYSGS
jgi:hypothetical protein